MKFLKETLTNRVVLGFNNDSLTLTNTGTEIHYEEEVYNEDTLQYENHPSKIVNVPENYYTIEDKPGESLPVDFEPGIYKYDSGNWTKI